MHGPDRWLTRLIEYDPSDSLPLLGGLFLDHHNVPASFVRLISPESFSGSGSGSGSRSLRLEAPRRGKRVGGEFLSVSLSIKRGDHGDSGYVRESGEVLGQNGNKSMEEEEEEAAAAVFKEEEKVRNVKARGPYAMNVTKHLLAGAVSAMVSRFAFCFYLFIF